jgi:ubiquinone/menaquinone biosynthesis C-methylase UbiE
VFSESAEYYDLVYRKKDYRGEVVKLEKLFDQYVPEGRTLLDIACGTGEHLRFLSGYQIAGIDLDPNFVRLVQEKLPGGRFQVADMSQFELGSKFDIVLCLFSSIGYLTTAEKILSALTCFKRHLAPGGAIFVEPFFEPDVWRTGFTSMTAAEDGDRKVCRIMTSSREGDRSILIGHYLFAEGAKVRHAVERHELRLTSRAEWQEFFRVAGLQAEYLAEDFSSRGLYVAKAFDAH